MLYHFFKLLFIPAVRAYFRSIHIQNASVIPNNGPVIFAVNHTSAFMDPILFAVETNRILHFLARGEAFNSNFSRALYKRLNMLPIYRPETTPGEVHKNKFAFQKSNEHLKKGRAIIIFPEGFSKTERRIRPIKTGLARIAFGAEAESDFKLNLKIIPVGINYSNPHLFQSDVFINVGDPIQVADYKESFLQNEKQAYDDLTDAVRASLEQCTVVIGDERLESFISSLEIIYNSSEKKERDSLLLEKFKLSKEVVAKVELLANKNPARFKELEVRLNNYISRLNKLNLKSRFMLKYPKTAVLWHLIVIVFGFPIFLLGFIGNLIPVSFTSLLMNKIKVREDFVGSLKLAGGMFIFLICYSLAALAAFPFGIIWIFIVPLSFYVSGIFSLSYIRHLLYLIVEIKHLLLFRNRPAFFQTMENERLAILKELEQ